MMKMTATVQANLDFASEADAVEKMRTAYGVTSIVTALVAASPIFEGRPSGWKSFRSAIWLETDEDRCGLLPFVFEPSFSFRDYAEWALDVPMFFVVRDGVYRPTGGLAFRRSLAEGFEGERATLTQRLGKLGLDRLLVVQQTLSSEALAAWLGDPTAS